MFSSATRQKKKKESGHDDLGFKVMDEQPPVWNIKVNHMLTYWAFHKVSNTNTYMHTLTKCQHTLKPTEHIFVFFLRQTQTSTWILKPLEYKSHTLSIQPLMFYLSFCLNDSMQYASTQVTFMHIKTRATVWQNLCRLDLLPPLLLLATSTPLGDIMARDSGDRLGFKATVAVEVVALQCQLPVHFSPSLTLQVSPPSTWTIKLSSITVKHQGGPSQIPSAAYLIKWLI